MARLRAALERPGRGDPEETAVALVTGKGGVGKTALAVRIAHDLRPRFPNGVLYVDLRGAGAAPVSKATALTGLLRALGVQGEALPAGADELAAMLRARLTGAKALIVLDDAPDEATVRALIPHEAGSAALVTSRRSLAALETTVRVRLEVLTDDDAVRLLTRIIGTDRIEREIETAQEIVRLCGGLPLALRIAGSRLAARPQWELADLVGRLAREQGRLGELVVGDLDVRASFQLSYQALSEPAKRTFLRINALDLRTFPAWVLHGSDVEPALDELVDAHLLDVDGRDPAGQLRFRSHDLMRQFARERLAEEALDETDLRAVVDRYRSLALHYSAFVRTRVREPDPALGGRPVLDVRPPVADALAVEWFDAEHGNLVALVEQSWQAGLWEETWLLAEAMVGYLAYRAHWSEWRQVYARALEGARRTGDERVEAMCLRRTGDVLHLFGDWERAAEYFTRALDICVRTGDQLGAADCHFGLGRILRLGRWQEALAEFSQALEIYQNLDDGYGTLDALSSIGDVHHLLRNDDEATTYLERSIATAIERGDARTQAFSLLQLGDVRGHRDIAEALELIKSSRLIYTELHDSRGRARTVVREGELWLGRRKLRRAQRCFEAALETFELLGDRWWRAIAVQGLGEVHLARHRWRDAAEHLEECLAVFRELGSPRAQAVQSKLEQATANVTAG